MTPQQLQTRTKRFAINVIRFSRKLPRTEEARVIGRQLVRAGTSVGANYRAVCRGKSDPDFIFKLGICIEESDETAYWLELLLEAGMVSEEMVANLRQEADELTRIFVASRERVRARLREKNTKPDNSKHKLDDQTSRIKNLESRIKNLESMIENEKSRMTSQQSAGNLENQK
jgi:four helix bundle protein